MSVFWKPQNAAFWAKVWEDITEICKFSNLTIINILNFASRFADALPTECNPSGTAGRYC